MLSQNLIHNALPALSTVKSVWQGRFRQKSAEALVADHYCMAKRTGNARHNARRVRQEVWRRLEGDLKS